jgi:starch-binding outer membrane protein, SusD/RagB family
MKYIYTIFIIIILCNTGCKKFIDINAPINTTNADNVFKTDVQAITVLTGIYSNMSVDDYNLGSGLTTINIYPSLSSDELTLFPGTENASLPGYYKNNLKANQMLATSCWMKTYKHIFVINSSIEGLNASTTLTPAIKQQLLGEAYFLRAFCYFYLVNLYGDVPLVLSTDYSITSLQPRTGTDTVYAQIKEDLLKAQSQLSNNYLDATLINHTDERVRPTKAAATALLARVYLYTKEWVNAETEATKVIDNTTYHLDSLNKAFLKNSNETIWALQAVGSFPTSNTGAALFFIMPGTGPSNRNPTYISSQLKNSFEQGDQRLNKWLNSVTVEGNTYYYPYKYKADGSVTSVVEYTIALRFAEVYLIRAEALIQSGNIAAGIADLNIIRKRATDVNAPLNQQLAPLSSSLSAEDALAAVLHERQVELFTEWGNRWFDLKRTNSIDEVMSQVTPLKGGSWDSRWALYPITINDLQSNPNLKQNPGYE